jgi:4-hydroxy-tetrahydrodipicolinate synthase
MKTLHGILPVLVTPLTSDERVDEKGLRRLIRHVMQASNSAVVICGSMGEFASLKAEERKRTIEIAVEEVGGKVPVVAGTGDAGTRKAIENTQVAEKAGANYALITLPYYYRTDHAGSVAHYRGIVKETGIRIVIYNIPEFTGVGVDVEAVKELGRDQRVCGIKDAGGDFAYFQKLVHEMEGSKHFSVIQGWDSLIFSGFVYGGDGAIVWASNLVPELPVRLYRAIRDGNLEEARSIQGELLKLGGIMQKRKSLHASVKAALSLMDICKATVSAPITPLSVEEMKGLEIDLKEFGLL